MTSRARILMLVTELSMGGAARVVRDVSAMLASRFEVHEAVFNAADGVDFPGPAKPHSLDVAGGGGLPTKLANFGRRVARTRRLKRRLGIDVSISHLEGAHWVDVLSRGREKVILCVHGSILHNRDIRGLWGWLRRRAILPAVYNRADCIVTVSRDIAPELVSLGVAPDRIRTINNGFDLQRIDELSREPLSDAEQALVDGGALLITAGRIAEQKNHAALIGIVAALRDRCSARLALLGDGPLREQLMLEAEAGGLRVWSVWSGEPLGPGYDLYLLGVERNPFRWIARADLFVFPSGWEGFPLALCEAMACGVPVVSSDCLTGPREILAPETALPLTPIRSAEAAPFGWLMPLLHVPATRPQAQAVWIETLEGLLGDAEERRRVGEAGRRRMADFSRETITAQWIALVEEMLGRPPR